MNTFKENLTLLIVFLVVFVVATAFIVSYSSKHASENNYPHYNSDSVGGGLEGGS